MSWVQLLVAVKHQRQGRGTFSCLKVTLKLSTNKAALDKSFVCLQAEDVRSVTVIILEIRHGYSSSNPERGPLNVS